MGIDFKKQELWSIQEYIIKDKSSCLLKEKHRGVIFIIIIIIFPTSLILTTTSCTPPHQSN